MVSQHQHEGTCKVHEVFKGQGLNNRWISKVSLNLSRGHHVTEEDSQGVQHPHDDALVVTLIIANHRTRRILIDNDSSADVLYLSAFEQM